MGDLMNSSAVNTFRSAGGRWPVSQAGYPRVLAAVMLILCGWLGNLAVAWSAPQLTAVDIANLPGGQVQLRFQLSQPVPAPHNFTINNPARIVLDFPGVRDHLSTNHKTINKGAVQGVTVLGNNSRTRAVISLLEMTPYSIRQQGSNILLMLGSNAKAVPTTAQMNAAQPSSSSAATGQPKLGAVKFHRGSEGQGIISVPIPGPSVSVNVHQQGEDIVADFDGARLPRAQVRRLDVTDFATPVTVIDAFNRKQGARLVIKRVGDSDFVAYQTNQRYTIEVRPKLQQAGKTGKKEYTGKPVSLNFQDIQVRAVLQILADFTGLNIVVSDQVQGNLTLRLHNVPWDQALDIILQTKGLSMRRNGNVIYVAPTSVLTKQDEEQLKAQQQRTQLEPLQTETIQVNYANAADLAKLIKTRSNGKNNSSLLSARGEITADPRTNMLLVQDIPSKIEQIRKLVAKLDRPVQQVQIDARIVIANSNFNKELGVRWGFSGVGSTGGSGVASIAGTANATDTMINNAASNLQQTGQAFPVTLPALKNRLGVNLAAANPTSSIALAILSKNFLVDLELSALQAEGEGQILSNPRVITADRQQAVVSQGTQIPYQTTSQNGTQTQFKDAVLQLKVTPQITPDGRIIMDLDVKKDQPNLNFTPPAIDTREIKTQVLVDDGETVVLGGVYEKNTQNNVDKVPLLGDIPGLGRLFRHTSKTNTKQELLIFVTPKILKTGSVSP